VAHSRAPLMMRHDIRFAAGIAVLFSAVACARPRSPRVEFTPGAQPAPFSTAVRVDHLLFLAGKIGTDSTGRLVPGGIQAETRQVMQSIRAELQRHAVSMDRVVKCTAFIADMAEWGAMNEVYATFFPGPKPARS